MDRFTELEVFTRIADEASLTRAADLLGLSVSGVSRCLTSLENRLGVRLVQRTTRQLSLTLEGERFAGKAREILGNLNAAEESVSAVKAEPLGTLRVGASLAFSLLHLCQSSGNSRSTIRPYRSICRFPTVIATWLKAGWISPSAPAVSRRTAP